MSMDDVISNVLRCVPQRQRELAITDAIADRRDQVVNHVADRAQAAAIRLHEALARRSGDWNGMERRQTDRRTICGDCPHKR